MSYVTVVGSANMDIGGVPYKKSVSRDSNPGRISLSVGGVGGNIARNLSAMGVDVRFITVLGGDIFSGAIKDCFTKSGVDLSHSLYDPDGRSSAYLFINDADGDMLAAVSDMEPSALLTPEVLERKLGIINGGDALVMDANLAGESIEFLASNCTVPIFADAVSAAKAPRLLPSLGKLNTFKPNRLEARLLTGKDTPESAACDFLQTGLNRVFITLGADGVYCADNNESLTLPVINVPATNTTGAGDAFTAALVKAHLEGMGLQQSGLLGLAAAAITAASDHSVCPEMNMDNIYRLLRKENLI